MDKSIFIIKISRKISTTLEHGEISSEPPHIHTYHEPYQRYQREMQAGLKRNLRFQLISNCVNEKLFNFFFKKMLIIMF